MCGRARLSSDVSEIKIAFGIAPERPMPNIAPSWNVASTDPLPVLHYDAKDGGRRLEVMRWGLIPYWAKDIRVGFSTINARVIVPWRLAKFHGARSRGCRNPRSPIVRSLSHI
jgi:putative SOS response-associated peptidase YedK